jgi:hypothetical protein
VSLTESGIALPDGVEWPEMPSRAPLPLGEHGVIVNETELADDAVRYAVQTYFEETASVMGANYGATTFQTYANEGSMLARAKYRTPSNVIDEIILARDLADRDDDVSATIGAMQAIAFSEGMRHEHKDEVTVALYDEVGKHSNLDHRLMELYRELLIASSVTSVQIYTREDMQFQPQGADRQRTRNVVAPLIGVLPAEQIRVLDNDLFQTGTLAYKPATGSQERWLGEFFNPSTTPARKAEMRREDPVLTTLLVEEIVVPGERPSFYLPTEDLAAGNKVYRLNPRMVERTTFPKGAQTYPRPMLTRNFALLEAKRLLNIMDYALLQGGANFIVVAKKGTDQRPALPEEVGSLRETMKRASKTGVIVGDHRLNIEVITPDLEELLNDAKRKLLGRKIAAGLLRLPDYSDSDAGGGQAVLADTEILARVISGDRRLIKRHVERIYTDTAKRNSASFEQGPATLWFPKIVLQGLQYFTDLVLKLRDRGDISRRSAVEAAGFDYDSEVQARKREKPDDRIMVPAAVPFSANGSPQDNGGGRPPGGSSANGARGSQPSRSTRDPARPTRVIQRNAGETVRAMFEEETGHYRIGELTYAILDEYPERQVGRVTAFERAAIEEIAAGNFEPQRHGPTIVVPVNPDDELDGIRAVRLAEGLSMLVGDRSDGALMARALCFRAPEHGPLDAEEHALRWGFAVEVDEQRQLPPAPAPAPVPEEDERDPLVVHVHVPNDPDRAYRTVYEYDDDGRVTSTRQEPIEES